jgi:NAD(P)-dependent dehydrogenase (short-subunit alcohol dehydrogenase family)
MTGHGSGEPQNEPRVVLVTGASGGIGTELVAVSAAAGDKVYALDRAVPDCSTVEEVTYHTADVADEDEMSRVVARIVGESGRIDVLFNNAGIQGDPRPFLDMPVAVWRDVIEINLTGAFVAGQAVARAMASAASGTILNTISQLAYSVVPGYVPYMASKAGLAHLTSAMALELAPRGVRVLGVAPGVVETRMTATLRTDQEWVRDRLARIPAGRFVSPRELANFMYSLTTPQADYLHGTTVVVDGGYLVGR